MNSSNAFRIRIFLFCCYSYEIETINTLIYERPLSFLENHTRFQSKMSKVFSDQKSPKILPFGVARTYIAYYMREYPPWS